MIIEDIMLVDDATSTGGTVFKGELLSQFVEEECDGLYDLVEINKALVECGIEPITLDQIRIIGIKGE